MVRMPEIFQRGLLQLERTLGRWLPDRPLTNDLWWQMRFLLKNGYPVWLRHPDGFCQRLHRRQLELASPPPDVVRSSDKELVKRLVTERVGPGHTVETLAVLHQAHEVYAVDFPLPCVVKSTHGSGDVRFFRETPPSPADRQSIGSWLTLDYFHHTREPNYRGLTPKIIVEPLLLADGKPPMDLKVFCFDGTVTLMQTDMDRFGDHRRDLYDPQGQLLRGARRTIPNSNAPFPFPARLVEIRSLAERLSAGFPFVRVDLYVLPDRCLVGELTHFPGGALNPFHPPALELKMGAWFDKPTSLR